MKDYSSIHMTFRFADVLNAKEVATKVVTKPNEISETSFSYTKIIPECKLLTSEEVTKFLNDMRNIGIQHLPDEATTQLLVEIYVKENSKIELDWDTLAFLESFGSQLTIEIFTV